MLQRLKSCFSAEAVNCGRQFEFDVLKTYLLFAMVCTHVIGRFSPWPLSTINDVLYYLIGGPYGAPGFMICMGIGAVYTKKKCTADFLQRGIKFLAIGFLLPIFTYGIIPFLLSTPFTFSELRAMVLTVDIMYFAGLAFLLIGFLKMARLTNQQILMVAIAMSSLATVIDFSEITNSKLCAILNLFFWVDGRSCFPLFGWFIFPAFGQVLGDLWKHCNDKKTFYLSVSPIAFGVASVYMISSYILKIGPGYDDDHYYGMMVLDAIMCLILHVGMFGIGYFVTLPLKETARRAIKRISSNVNNIYCLHYALLSFLQCTLIRLGLEWKLNTFMCILLGFTILAASYFLAELYSQLKKALFHLLHKKGSSQS